MQKALATSLRDRDKEREYHKRDEAVQVRFCYFITEIDSIIDIKNRSLTNCQGEHYC